MALLDSRDSEKHASQNRDDIEELQLLIRVLLGDIEAFDGLVIRYRRALVAVAEPILRCREAAEDVAQEAFLIALSELGQLADLSKFAAWLCAITRHRACRLAARESRFEAHEPQSLEILAAQSGDAISHPVEVLSQQCERERVAFALRELPADYQIALRLRYYEEWPVARIADFLGLPITTVKWRLHQGRLLMRRQLIQPSEANHDQSTPRNSRTANSTDARGPAGNGASRARPTKLTSTAPFAVDARPDHSIGERIEPDRVFSERQQQRYRAIQPHFERD